MSNNFYRGIKFALPISLILWALFVWLALVVFNGAQAAEVDDAYQGPHGFQVMFKPLSTESTITEASPGLITSDPYPKLGAEK